MSDITADQLAQRIFDCRLLETKEIESALADAGGRGRATIDEFIKVLLRSGKMTNWQLARVMEGHTRGYFYGVWKVLYIVGAGTFARVYRGTHRETGEIRAIKVLRSRYSNDTDTRDRFAREGKMVMKLRHPNIVPIYDVGEEKGRSFMVMDFVEGQNLRDYVKAHKRLEVKTALTILRDLSAGLAYASERGITHRDMKLSNVLLSATGQSRVVDFGLATVNAEFSDDPDDLFNPRSIDYAGLEKNTNAPKNDPRSDVFFLGCMFYQMVSGEPPLFETRERIKRLSAKRYREIKPLSSHDKSFPHRVVILCNRLMDLNFKVRVQTPRQAMQETEKVIKALEEGKDEKFDAAMAEKLEKEYSALVEKVEEGAGKTVMVIESNPKVQDFLREKLKGIGYRVLIVSDPDRGLMRFDNLDPAEDRPADCMIFSCAGTGRDGIAGFLKFSEMSIASEISAILLLTEKQQKYLKELSFLDNQMHLGLPAKFKNIRNALRRLLKIEVASADGGNDAAENGDDSAATEPAPPESAASDSASS